MTKEEYDNIVIDLRNLKKALIKQIEYHLFEVGEIKVDTKVVEWNANALILDRGVACVKLSKSRILPKLAIARSESFVRKLHDLSFGDVYKIFINMKI